MRFTKMHGAGNDYVYVNGFETRVENPAALARAISDRHTGVGSDGLILILPSKRADCRMAMYNADGSEGEMCGNGIRCIGKFVYDRGLVRRREVTVETRGGRLALQLHVKGGKVDAVTVDMGAPRVVPKSFYRGADGSTMVRGKLLGRAIHVLSMGNPHCVIFVDDPEKIPLATIGPKFENHPAFPSRTNVEFVRVADRRSLVQRTWERGSGETLCCGSGACAAFAAAHATGRVGLRAENRLRGGTLTLEIGRDGAIFMTGPAVEVFSGDWPNRPARGRVQES